LFSQKGGFGRVFLLWRIMALQKMSESLFPSWLVVTKERIRPCFYFHFLFARAHNC
jgi:hypothetical protein